MFKLIIIFSTELKGSSPAYILSIKIKANDSNISGLAEGGGWLGFQKGRVLVKPQSPR